MIIAAPINDERVIFIAANTIQAVIPDPSFPDERCLVICQAFPQGVSIQQHATEFGMEWLVVLNTEPNFAIEEDEDGPRPGDAMH